MMKGLLIACSLFIGVAGTVFSTAAAEGLRPLHFAISAMISPQETFSIYVDIAHYLAERIHRDIELKQRRTYQEVNRLLQYGEIDFGWLCTGGFLEARRDFGATALATPLIQGAPYYYAYVIVPRDSPVETFDDLRGRTFAFTDPLSNTGRKFPAYLVGQRGERVGEFFRRFFYTYSHDRAIEAVAKGVADGASVDSQVYEFLLALKPDLIARTRIIQVSQPFGAPPIVASPKLSPRWRTRIQEELLKMGADSVGRTLLDRLRVEGFVLPPSDLYDGAQWIWEVAGQSPPGP